MVPPYSSAILYSGGLDSSATLYHLERTGVIDFDDTLAIHFDYGQVAFKLEQRAIVDMQQWMCFHRGGAFDVRTIQMDVYRHMVNTGVKGLPRLLRYGDSSNFTIPWRNYLMVMHALAYCEMLGIETLYTTMGYHDDGGIWDNTPPAFAVLQKFLDEIASQLRNNNPGTPTTRIFSPTYNKSRKEWISQEIDEGFPHQHTYSCLLYTSPSPRDS